jgi:hypothetical protein
MTGPGTAKKSSVWRTLVAVLWSFLGVRKHSDSQDDIAKLSPFHLIGVGIAACFVFVIGLMFFVKWVVAH